MEEERAEEASIDFIPAVCFVRRGVAKERPEKVTLTAEELAKVIKETKQKIVDEGDEDLDDDDEDADEDRMDTVEENDRPTAGPVGDEFEFDKYDNEKDAEDAAGIGNVADIDEDNYLEDDDNDSEAGDEVIVPTDNLILVGHVQDDASTLEVWVFNEEEESLYTHHEFFLPSLPLCIEWLNYDPESSSPGNICAIGCMDPIITLWDIDIQNAIEPIAKLGSTKKKSKIGHSDAVLDLAWNEHFDHILASGSVDRTVNLWDLASQTPHTTISAFNEKVQSIEFHPRDHFNLLTGCADGLVRLFDCRASNEDDGQFPSLDWQVSGGAEIEKVLWNPTDSNYFVTGTNKGSIHYADIRQPTRFVWSHETAHSDEISGVCFNAQQPNLLQTTSADGLYKVWKFNSTELVEVYQHDFNLGRLHCMKQSPDDPFTLVFGGELNPRCRVYNIKNFEVVRRTFGIPDAV